MIKGINVAERNGAWKGDKVGVNALHGWIKRRLPKPSYCERCNKKTRFLDCANISQKYLRRLDDWEWLCRSCHMNDDNRIKNLLKGWKNRILRPCQKCGKKTYRLKFCKECAKIARREWWKKYNQLPKRRRYRKQYYQN